MKTKKQSKSTKLTHTHYAVLEVGYKDSTGNWDYVNQYPQDLERDHQKYGSFIVDYVSFSVSAVKEKLIENGYKDQLNIMINSLNFERDDAIEALWIKLAKRNGWIIAPVIIQEK